MDKLKRKRRPLRATVTRVIGELERELGNEIPNKETLVLRRDYLKDVVRELNDYDSQVMELMLEEKCTDEEQDAEYADMENYRLKWMSIRMRVNTAVELGNSNGSVTSESNHDVRQGGVNKRYKLPKIEIKKFNGELTEWLSFWSQFQKIHDDNELHETDKFQYLVQSMVKGSRAFELVESYPQTAENYPKVVSALQERFGKKKMLKQVYVRELQKMVLINGSLKGKIKLSQMYIQLESHLRSLESLGVTVDLMATFLYPMVESSLPEDILIAWQRNNNYGKDGTQENPPKTELDYLMEFLKQEVAAEDQRRLARGEREVVQDKRTSVNKKSHIESMSTVAGLHVGQTVACIFCEKSHASQECVKAQLMTLEERRKVVRDRRACFCCLRMGHPAKNCRALIRCTGCSKKHFHLMCPEGGERAKGVETRGEKAEVTSVHSNHIKGGLVLLKTMWVKLITTTGERAVRVLLDEGSQRSYIRREIAVGANCPVVGVRWERNCLFGGTVTECEKCTVYQVHLQGMSGSNRGNLKMTEKSRIAGSIPAIPSGPWLKELQKEGVSVNDRGTSKEEIDILLGADLIPSLLTGKIVQLSCGLTAVETVLGWAVMGPLPVELSSAMHVTTLLITEKQVSQLWDLELLGIRDPAEHKAKGEQEKQTKEHFLSTVCRDESGRYCVGLPWVDVMQELPDNYGIAEKRLLSTTRKLRKDDKFEEYDQVFKGWLEEGFIEVVTDRDERKTGPCHYLPHHPVYKLESSSTPIRPVFDASYKVGRKPSLNDCLEKGPNYIERIPEIMLRFREKGIGVVSDIRKAFQMIKIRDDDSNYLRFLWWEDGNCEKLKVLRHKRVVFGVKSSPFLLGAVIEYHLGQVAKEDKVVTEKFMKSLYVDNCVTSVDSDEEYEHFKERATYILGQARMELTRWEFGSADFTEGGQLNRGDGEHSRENFAPPPFIEESSITTTNVLGMKWNRRTDTLGCANIPEIPEKLSKRTLLSTLQKVFDPMGLLSPAMILPKLLLQEAWIMKRDWDEDLPTQVRSRFERWTNELKCLEQVQIPRNVTGGVQDREKWQLHVFCDASQHVYATVIFLRVEHPEGVEIHLLQSKARVAPIKKISIPRLELLGCVLGGRLARSVIEALSLEVPVFYWSDSTTALAWIKGNDEWGTFVGNRVKEICTLSNTEDWRYVSGLNNPADFPSRGCTPLKLLRSEWWRGPKWLRESSERWPTQGAELDITLVDGERKKRVGEESVMVSCSKNFEESWYGKRFSSYFSCVKVMAWVQRFVNKARGTSKEVGELSIQEIKAAERQIWKCVQREAFSESYVNSCDIRVTRDYDGLICVESKLTNRRDSEFFRRPVLLPHSHPIVERMIREEHLKNGHAGIQFLMSRLREKCWILRARKAIRRVVQRCVRCRRYKERSPVLPCAPLPENRVKDARVFEVTGVDAAGPLFLKGRRKVWILIFTCAVYRGIHLELVTSLSTDSFLLAFLRFVSRRGRPSVIYSDNGTNFVGAFNVLRQLDWKKIEQETKIHQIQWKFNPPTAAWWGGWWERLIQTVKGLLKRMLGHEKLNHVQLETCLCEVEAVVNARPLTYVTEDQEDLVALTPAMFMQDQQMGTSPEEAALNADGFRRKYRELVQLRGELRRRFRSEYLGLLVQRNKTGKGREFRVGEVVLVAEDNKRRLDWPMAKVLELYPGKDGVERVAKVKTACGEFVRPIQRLFPLEVGLEYPLLESVTANRSDKTCV